MKITRPTWSGDRRNYSVNEAVRFCFNSTSEGGALESLKGKVSEIEDFISALVPMLNLTEEQLRLLFLDRFDIDRV